MYYVFLDHGDCFSSLEGCTIVYIAPEDVETCNDDSGRILHYAGRTLHLDSPSHLRLLADHIEQNGV